MRKLIMLLASVAAVFSFMSVGISAASAAPVNAHPYFVCPDRDACFFPNTDFTGSPQAIFFIGDPVNHGQWKVIPSAQKGSLTNASGSAIEVWNDQHSSWQCVGPNSQLNLQNFYGYWYAKYGSDNCSGIPDHN